MTLAEVEVVVSVRGCGVLVEVSDPDKAKVPTLRADAEQDGGLGLVLVAALAERWGHESRPFTKCVWAYFVVPERPC
ncbi:ATP-binding protein [Streptomyces sp. NPDC057474]|uniref:ATP-binding protein n=1 Tax=Streptomyces sp. NPDC057474 TaxID=3346144 RepID=UPI0036A38DED